MYWLQVEVAVLILILIVKEIYHMSSTPPGLAALNQAVTDLTAAVSAAVTELQNLAAALQEVDTEDPAVATAAASLETLASNLNSAVTAATPASGSPSAQARKSS